MPWQQHVHVWANPERFHLIRFTNIGGPNPNHSACAKTHNHVLVKFPDNQSLTLPSWRWNLNFSASLQQRRTLMKNHFSALVLPPSLPRSFRLLALVPMVVSMCGCPANKPGADPANATAAAGGKNTVVIRGSNTIGEELAPRLITEFRKEHSGITFNVETKATGYGMAALRVGQCDIAAASRSAIPADLDLAKEANMEMGDYVIGAYSVGVVVNPSNPVNDLTNDQVHDIFTGKIQNWKDVGGPDAGITIYIRDPISGTYLGFKEIAMSNEDYAPHCKLLTNYTAIVAAVAADPNGIGYSGLAMAQSGGGKLLSIGGVAASTETVHAGKYPYARLLRFYTNKDHESPPTKDFIQFVLAPQGQAILTQMGFTPKP